MATALSMKREHVYVLAADQAEAQRRASLPEADQADMEPHLGTRWVYRRLTAQESWDLRDTSLEATMSAGNDGTNMVFKAGRRCRFILTTCLLRVEDLGDPDRPGETVAYPGAAAPEATKLSFFDRVPGEWLAEVGDAIYEASEVSSDTMGESRASQPASSGAVRLAAKA